VQVRNNYIGGRAPGATGGIWENAGTQNFRGIVMDCGSSASLANEVSGNTVSSVSLTGVSSASLTAVFVEGGRSVLTGNTMGTVSNTGTSGINSLVSRATTVLDNFTVSSGQVMVVENGLTIVLGDLTNAGILNHTGGDILVHGDFTNSGTFAQTLGDTEIKGDMLNSGQFTCSTGKLKLTGNGPQLVSGGLYFNLEVNGAGVKTLTDDVQVYNGVQMLDGVLATGPFRIKLEPLANLSETDASYVLGRVEVRRTVASGTTQEFGGVGLALRPAAGSTAPGATLVSRVTGTAPIGAGGNQGILRYFDITPTATSGLNMSMTMGYFDHELNSIAPANLSVFKSGNLGNTWQNMGRTSSTTGTAGSGTVVLASVTSAGRWTLGSLLRPLPVGLTAFRAERQGRNALLVWSTAMELNNRGFGIEASADGVTFREIGFVPAPEGNSTTARAYRFVDAGEGKAGLRYYRLRQEDFSGETHRTAPQALRFDAAAAVLVAYPTRFERELTVELSGPAAAPATLRLLDGMGREVWRSAQPVATGGAPLRLPVACPAGTYLLTAEVNGQVLRQRVVRE
jgi:hypothetical protein